MAGLYIHIPFCRSKCAYCDFFSMPVNTVARQNPQTIGKYCEAVLKEFELRYDEVKEPIDTIYIGGGTPTAIDAETLFTFLHQLRHMICKRENKSDREFSVKEFTIEANPEDITPGTINKLRIAGINRISIGIQSFNSCQLKSISRQHDAPTSIQALKYLSESGINYSADLIYGLPDQNPESWQEQLSQLLEFNPPHFSAYLLSYEPGTKLYIQREQKKVSEADEDTANIMYSRLIESASNAGYNHYEISNFARPGKEAVHNSSYWNLTPYIGLGCSAHSFDGENRRINPSNLNLYINSLTAKTPKIVAITEDETIVNKINDYIITSLRTQRGLSPNLIENKWGRHALKILNDNIAPYLKEDVIRYNESGNLIVNEKYWLTSDAILREIIFDANELI